MLIINVFLCVSSQGLADNCVVAKVDGEVWDLDRPFEKDSELVLLKFDDPEGTINLSILYLYRGRIMTITFVAGSTNSVM